VGVFPSDISEAGNLVRRLSPSNNAFFWRDVGGFKDLGPGTANAFDRSGGIYGSHDGMPGMWSPSGGFTPFSAPPAPYTKGDALAGNIFGQATGRFTGGDGDASFAWTGTDYQFPALHLFPAPPGIESSSGQAINDAGVIAVHGIDADGNDLPVLFHAPYDLASGNLDGQSEFVKIRPAPSRPFSRPANAPTPSRSPRPACRTSSVGRTSVSSFRCAHPVARG